MEWIVTTGKTVSAAVDAALDQLGVDEQDIEYEIIEESRRGFLGLLGGASSARIRARVKPISREKPDRRRRSGSRGEGAGDRDRARGASAGGGSPRGQGEPGGGGGTGSAGQAGQGARRGRERVAAVAPETREDVEPPKAGRAAPPGSDPRPARRRRPPRTSSAAAGATTATSPRDGEESVVSGSEVSLEEQVELAENFTRGLVERFGLSATVSARAEGDDDVIIEVDGSDLGILIGPRAATIDAIQELVRTAVQRRIGGHGARVHVDVAGYRARRQEALAEFARQAAQRALESGRDQVFEPMSPVDRKIVHDIVNEIEGVATVSEGEEPRRRVVIKAV